MLWAEKIAGNRKKQQIFQSKDEILNKMGRENSQIAQFWRIFSAITVIMHIHGQT